VDALSLSEITARKAHRSSALTTGHSPLLSSTSIHLLRISTPAASPYAHQTTRIRTRTRTRTTAVSNYNTNTNTTAMADEVSFNALVANLVEWKDRLVNNSVKSWEEMSAQRWLRIVVIVGAYLLVRPYLLSHAERSRKKREAKEAADLGLDADTELSANDFRGGKKSKKGDAGVVQRSSLR
jgi:hypothetical protein